MHDSRALCVSTLAALGFCVLLPSEVPGQEAGPMGVGEPPIAETIDLPESVPDPLEPFNRVMWSVNNGLMSGVIRPTARVYRFIVIKPVRTGIRNFGRNLTYPGRLINNLLQGNWVGARDESYRFACNTTVGVAGFMDVAERWKIPKSDADFGQTFGRWGWDPGFYLMLPIIGPGNERDTVGLVADTAANPLVYISPYSLEVNAPWTYLGPYAYFSGVARYNEASDGVEEFVRFVRSASDPYSEVQYAWTFARNIRDVVPTPTDPPDESSWETLESVFFTYRDPEFPARGRTRSALIPTTGRRLKFTYWMQRGRAPVVYIVPGMGAHRLAKPCLALAELVFRNGYSAVCVSSVFNPEFMENASTAALPAYLPVDGQDLHIALTEVDRRLRGIYPKRLGDKALMGYSMGAFHALFLAGGGGPTYGAPLIEFDRFVAISPPVRLVPGVARLDEFYHAPLAWPGAERTDRIANTFRKVASLSRSTLTPETPLPFGGVESRFLIGLTFRLTLRDIIYSSQRRSNAGVLDHPIRRWRRDPLYQEILQFSYGDYFEQFVVPYYEAKGLGAPVAEAVAVAGDLRTYEAGLRGNDAIHVLANENDFLLEGDDIAWLRATFGEGQLRVFKQGGHMGNLSNPGVQEAILGALKGLQPVP